MLFADMPDVLINKPDDATDRVLRSDLHVCFVSSVLPNDCCPIVT
jgi:hypothetical protein